MHRGMAQFPVRSVVNSGEAKVSQIGNRVCGHFVSLSLVFTRHIRSDGRPNQNIYTFCITESTTTGCNEHTRLMLERTFMNGAPGLVLPLTAVAMLRHVCPESVTASG